MSTSRATRGVLWFWLCIMVSVYVLVSASLAIATADTCDGHFGGEKTWAPFPPHWECPSR